MADDLTARIVDLVAKALAEREAASGAAPARPAPAPAPAPSPAVVTAGRIVTREDVQRAAAAGPPCRCPQARS